MSAEPSYGTDDASFRACGGEAGIRKLVEDFYACMEVLPETRRIRDMHPKDLTTSIDKLARFLCGWLGGPKLYHEKYGSIALPRVHSHLPVGSDERDAWLLCMHEALEPQPFAEDFKRYLLEQVAVPAERIRNLRSGKPLMR